MPNFYFTRDSIIEIQYVSSECYADPRDENPRDENFMEEYKVVETGKRLSLSRWDAKREVFETREELIKTLTVRYQEEIDRRQRWIKNLNKHKLQT